jgi:hypothetical protein
MHASDSIDLRLIIELMGRQGKGKRGLDTRNFRTNYDKKDFSILVMSSSAPLIFFTYPHMGP